MGSLIKLWNWIRKIRFLIIYVLEIFTGIFHLKDNILLKTSFTFTWLVFLKLDSQPSFFKLFKSYAFSSKWTVFPSTCLGKCWLLQFSNTMHLSLCFLSFPHWNNTKYCTSWKICCYLLSVWEFRSSLLPPWQYLLMIYENLSMLLLLSYL